LKLEDLDEKIDYIKKSDVSDLKRKGQIEFIEKLKYCIKYYTDVDYNEEKLVKLIKNNLVNASNLQEIIDTYDEIKEKEEEAPKKKTFSLIESESKEEETPKKKKEAPKKKK